MTTIFQLSNIGASLAVSDKFIIHKKSPLKRKPLKQS